MTTDIVVAPRPAPLSLDMVRTFQELAPLFIHEKGAQAIPASIKTPQQAIAVMTLGAELGVGPVTAFANIAIVNGRCEPMGKLMLGVAQARDRSVKVTYPDYSLEKMTCRLTRDRFNEPIIYSIGLEAVPAAAKKGPVWGSYPLDMLMWFVTKRAMRMGCSDLILVGGVEDEAAEAAEDSRGTVTVETVEMEDGTKRAIEVERLPAVVSEAEADMHAGRAPAVEVENAAPADAGDGGIVSEDLAVEMVLKAGGQLKLDSPTICRFMGIDPESEGRPMRNQWFTPANDDGVSFEAAADLAIACMRQVANEMKGGASGLQAVETVDPLAQLRALRATSGQGELTLADTPAEAPIQA